ncbi:MAG: hypothetical protein UHM52_01995 [Acutalibacteraceae bacterium]|nr:hypothetical protein [Clostridia bacterium]MEE1187740.1 hypothetical protein [Acutalibacteraceae bacterium]MEE3311297.1 hypothetical protein [Acutalibacteraceae bacterium]
MKTRTSRIFAILMAVAMVLMMTGCSEATRIFLKNGWDYEVDGVQYEPGFNDTYESVAPAVNSSAADRSAYGSYTGPAASGSTVTAGGAATAGAKAGAAKAGSNAAAPAANKTSYTAAEALELYKSAANKVKTTAKSATRTSETIRTISGSIPSLYSSFGFKEGTKTEKVVAKGASELKDKFPVEKKSYTCNLSASDIKSATVQSNGSSKVVTIVVKDDNPGTYSNSSKCVSTISIPIGTWTCKGVTLRGTIDANGRLTSLYYKMPTYVTQGSDAFAFSLEQNWSVAY